MAKGINKVILIGNLGKDPIMRRFPDGGVAANFAIATTDTWKNKQTGMQEEKTEWHQVVCKNRLAEVCEQFLRKGSKVYIEGSLRTRKWEKNGENHYTTEVIGTEMQMLDGKQAGNDAQSMDTYKADAFVPYDDDPIPF
jgi:single-strand DNA-binding protein